MPYLMVTDWADHWRDGQRTHFSQSTLKGKMVQLELKSGTRTLFLAFATRGPRLPRRAWIGKVHNIQRRGPLIFFRVALARHIPFPTEYANLWNGWYHIDKLPEEGSGLLF